MTHLAGASPKAPRRSHDSDVPICGSPAAVTVRDFPVMALKRRQGNELRPHQPPASMLSAQSFFPSYCGERRRATSRSWVANPGSSSCKTHSMRSEAALISISSSRERVSRLVRKAMTCNALRMWWFISSIAEAHCWCRRISNRCRHWRKKTKDAGRIPSSTSSR
jgi:hypothetical protein